MKIIFFNKSIYKGDNPVKKRKGDSPLKSSGSDCTCANTDYFIARFCINIVRLNRYVIKCVSDYLSVNNTVNTLDLQDVYINCTWGNYMTH